MSKAPAASPPLKNLKHTAILAESGINYDQPLLPTQIAQLKADRLGKEKEKQKVNLCCCAYTLIFYLKTGYIIKDASCNLNNEFV